MMLQLIVLCQVCTVHLQGLHSYSTYIYITDRKTDVPIPPGKLLGVFGNVLFPG